MSIELAKDLLSKGINIDKATGDLSRSIWHLVIEKKSGRLSTLYLIGSGKF
jgi:hypothetical protein